LDLSTPQSNDIAISAVDDAASKDKASGNAGSLKVKLKELKQLLNEGLIIEEEAAAKRAKLLSDR
jgi:cytochrome c-type biogenesis protein CcmH/NrfG